MRLITLNIWGGRVREPLFTFIRDNQDVDIFCFQELYNKSPVKMSDDRLEASLDIYNEFREMMPDYKAFFRPTILERYGVGLFIKKDISILEEGEIILKYVGKKFSGSGGDHTRNMEWVRLKKDDREFVVMNVHGIWTGIDKYDTPDRIEQSRRIREFADALTVPYILCGDFNLRPDTKSIAMVAAGNTNLVEKFGVTSTRTSLYTKPERYADFMFTSPGVTVKDFRVLSDEVSDHAPLALEFEID